MAKKKAAKKSRAKAGTFKSLKAAGKALKQRASKTPSLTLPSKREREESVPVPVVIERKGVVVERPKGFAPRPANTRWPAEIKIGERHRKDFGDIAGLAHSFNARGTIIQPIAITQDGALVAGERRLKAWQHPACQFRQEPIPVHVITIDAIVAGEWDENAHRKDFTPEESVSIKKAIEQLLKQHAKDRQRAHGGTAPGRKSEGKTESFRANERAAALTGTKRRTLEKAEKVVDAAKNEPEKYGKLLDDMNRTGKVNGPFKRLQVMQQTEALRKAPPPLPMRGPYMAVTIDHPWPAEKDAEQEDIDKRGRAMREYPEMALAEGIKFYRSKEFQALLAPDASVYFWTTNHHMDHAFVLLKAMGFEKHSTIGTWGKDKMGRGQVLRGKTEHCIIATRGKPTINLTNQTTLWQGPGWEVREDSRKPDAFFDLVEQLTPAPRYAEIFSRGGRGPLWDCHGDQAGKFAPSIAKEAQAEILKEIQRTPDELKLSVLEAVEKGETPDLRLIDKKLLGELDKLVTGKKKLKLTGEGTRQLAELREEAAVMSIMADLPDDFDGLLAAYKTALSERHEAIVRKDRAAIATVQVRVEAIVNKNENGGKQRIGVSGGALTWSEKFDKLARAAAAPVGTVPVWGQRGLFAVTVDDLPCLIHADTDGEIKAFAVDPDRDFVDADGDLFVGLNFFDPLYDVEMHGKTVDQYVIEELRREIDDLKPITKGKGKGKTKSGRKPMTPPAKVYALPAHWDGNARPKPIAAGKARAALKAEASECPAPQAQGESPRPTADEPAAGQDDGRGVTGAASAPPAGDLDELDIPAILDRRPGAAKAAAGDGVRTETLVNPRLLPSAKEVAAIADRAEAGK